MPKTAFCYCRVSSDKQGDGGIDSQKQVCQDLWEKYFKAEYPKIEFFCDLDVSARQKEFATRPKAKELSLRVTNEDIIIFSKIDRAFRSVRDLYNQMDFWSRAGIRVACGDFGLSAHGGGPYYDSKSIMSKVLLLAWAMCAEMEGHVKSQRAHDFNSMAKRQGRAIGLAPYGYKLVRRGEPMGAKHQPPAWIQPNDEEQAILKFILQRKREGFGYLKISRHLAANGVKKRNGKPADRIWVLVVYQDYLKVVAARKKLQLVRGHKLREWEFITDNGVLAIRFDREHLKEAAEAKDTDNG